MAALDKISLSVLWPKPDWSSHINDERPDEVIKILTGVYQNIRVLPRESEGAISDEQWSDAYTTSISILKAMFRKTRTIEQAQAINERFAERFNFDYKSINQLPIESSYIYWAVSKKVISNKDKDAFDLSDKAVKAVENNNSAKVEIKPAPIAPITPQTSTPVAESRPSIEPASSEKTEETYKKGRFGPVFVTKDINLDQFRLEFNLRQITLSPDTQDKNQQLLNEAYESLCDLADALELPRKWIGMTTLALRVGHAKSLGTDERHQSITYNGEDAHQSIAHQWINCLDARIASNIQANSMSVDRYVTTMYQKELTGSHTEKTKATYLIIKKITKGMSAFSDNKLEYFHSSVLFETTKSLPAGIITAPSEMFARAFDAYIEGRLTTLSRTNHHLTADTLKQDNVPYPINKERENISLLFTALFITLKQPESSAKI